MFTSLFNTIVKVLKSVKGLLRSKHWNNMKPVSDVWVDEGKIVMGTEKFEWTKWFTGQYRFVDNPRRKDLVETHRTHTKIFGPMAAGCCIACIVMLATGHFSGALLMISIAWVFEGIAVAMTGLEAKKAFFAA